MNDVTLQQYVRNLLQVYQSGNFADAEKHALNFTCQYPNHPFGWKVLGAIMSQLGKKNKAVSANKKAVKLSSKDAEAHSNLGASLEQIGKLKEAHSSYKEAISLKPDYAQAHYNLGINLQTQGRFHEAKISYRNVLKLMPQNVLAHNNLGTTFKELKRFDEAEKEYRLAISIKSDYAEAHNNLGNILQELGRLDEAELSLEQAISLKSNYVEAYYNLGITYQENGKTIQAMESYNQAIILKPNFARAHSSLGVLFQELGSLKKAELSCRKAILYEPDYAIAYYNLGVTLQKIGKKDETIQCYKQAIKLSPNFANAYLNLFDVFEKNNEIDNAQKILRNANGKVTEKKADFLYYEAFIQFRKEEYDLAENLLKKINKDKLSINKKTNFLKFKANFYHHKKDYDSAFEGFKSMNKNILNSPEYDIQTAEKFFNQQIKKVSQIKKLLHRPFMKSEINPNYYQPTFLIGFPRSGTTLLDTILRSHSKVDVVEEQPMVQLMKKSFDFGASSSIASIETMSTQMTEKLSNIYLEKFKKYCQINPGNVSIDKLPLNILEVPIINKVFPEAKFIFAVRHPFDCIMSCWMQNFKLNPAMSNMIDLDRIVDFYCLSMELLSLSISRYNLNIHKIRYEDLVVNFKGEISNLLNFLDLNWEDELKDYQKTALSRARINTPSYSQVVKPIYNTASYRWKNYEEQLVPYKSRLDPWLKSFGYVG